MISDEMLLLSNNKTQPYVQANMSSMRKAFYDSVKLQFLKQSAEYLGSTISLHEIKDLMAQSNYIRS